jgi:hypothetical protein
MTSMKTLTKIFMFIVLLATLVTAKAQTVPDAYEGPFSIYAGGFGSFFKPDYPPSNLYGAGTFVDIAFRKHVQIEAEIRWLEFNKPTAGSYQINYSIGPRIPIRKFGRFDTYGKFLISDTKLDYGNLGYGHYLDYTMGGGADVRLTHRLRLRAIDFEYHYIPAQDVFTSSVTPYGVSVGIAYRVF